ncbi:hypothetical protein ACOMHN_066961 [Nucella lapillus]
MERVSQVVVPDNQEAIPQNLDMHHLMQLVSSLQQTDKDRVEIQLMDGDRNDPNRPAVSVVVETLSVEDLLSSDKGRKQLNQLSAQLDQAMSSLNHSIQMVHGADQVGTMVENLQSVSAETMLGGLFSMLAGEGRDDVFVGILGSQSLQVVNQLQQILDQLPGLKGILGKFYQLVEHLRTESSSTTKNLQELFINVVRSLNGINNGTEQKGLMMEIETMLEMALNGLTANLELFETMVQKMSNSPSFLLAVNDTHCLVNSLQDDLSTNTAVGCLQQLIQALSLVNQSDYMIVSVINSLNHLLDNPGVLQAFTDLVVG